MEVLPDEPNHVLVGLREPLLLLQGAAAASPHVGGGPPGGRDPVVDTRAAVVGRREQPVGVSQLLAAGGARGGLAVLGAEAA